MKPLLTAALVFASLLSAQAAQAQDTNRVAQAQDTNRVAQAQTEAATSTTQPIIISWDRVGGKEKGWV